MAFVSSESAFARYQSLESIEDRIIYYLLSPINKTEAQMPFVRTLWSILYDNDINCLNRSAPLDYSNDIAPLICNTNAMQDNFRVFRSPYLEESWAVECSMLKIYVDSVIPQNHLIGTVNIGIDAVIHNKLMNVAVAVADTANTPQNAAGTVIGIYPVGEYNGVEFTIDYQSRLTLMLRCILTLLNGANIQGVGMMQFNGDIEGSYSKARLGIWNNKNYYGQKIIFSCMMSGEC